MADIERVGVAGFGLMGSGIVQVAATSGCAVVVREVTDELCHKGMAGVRAGLAKSFEKGELAEPPDTVLARIRPTVDLGAFADCHLVIEAITENLAAKQALFRELARVAAPQALLATNTSSLSVTEIGSVTGSLGRFVGMHFFNPVPRMKLVELVRTVETSDAAFSAARAFVEKLGKTVIAVSDSPGFVVNHLLVPYILDAVRALERKLATKEEIDAAMKLGCGHPMGPIELLDFVGLDTTLAIAETFFAAFGEARYAAPPLLRQMVLAGRLGRKSGRGFYDHARKPRP
jgi:3-hydroxybutyryl-CoA dehydrogenase